MRLLREPQSWELLDTPADTIVVHPAAIAEAFRILREIHEEEERIFQEASAPHAKLPPPG